MGRIVILDNIRSAHNIGSIFRTCDGAGVSKIYLVGYTPAPVDRFGRVQPEIKKTSLGATESVEWEVVEKTEGFFDRLHTEGFKIVAVEQQPNSVSIYDFKQPAKVAYIFGNEIDGVSTEFCKTVDTIIEIPMNGKKESLNVSVTVGIVLFKHNHHKLTVNRVVCGNKL